jgi:hypothetical protein
MIKVNTKIQNETTRNIVTGVVSTTLGLGGAALAVAAIAGFATKGIVKGAVGLVAYVATAELGAIVTKRVITPKSTADKTTAEDLMNMYPHLFQEEDLVDKETPKQAADRRTKDNTSIFALHPKPLTPQEAFGVPVKEGEEPTWDNIRINSSPTVQQLSETLGDDVKPIIDFLKKNGFPYDPDSKVANTTARYIALESNKNLIFY